MTATDGKLREGTSGAPRASSSRLEGADAANKTGTEGTAQQEWKQSDDDLPHQTAVAMSDQKQSILNEQLQSVVKPSTNDIDDEKLKALSINDETTTKEKLHIEQKQPGQQDAGVTKRPTQSKRPEKVTEIEDSQSAGGEKEGSTTDPASAPVMMNWASIVAASSIQQGGGITTAVVSEIPHPASNLAAAIQQQQQQSMLGATPMMQPQQLPIPYVHLLQQLIQSQPHHLLAYPQQQQLLQQPPLLHPQGPPYPPPSHQYQKQREQYFRQLPPGLHTDPVTLDQFPRLDAAATASQPQPPQQGTPLQSRHDGNDARAAESSQSTIPNTDASIPTVQTTRASSSSNNNNKSSVPTSMRIRKERPVIAVSSARTPKDFLLLAKRVLAKEEALELSALESAIVVAIDTAHMLTRSNLAFIQSVNTSMIDGFDFDNATPNYRNRRARILIVIERTEQYKQWLEKNSDIENA